MTPGGGIPWGGGLGVRVPPRIGLFGGSFNPAHDGHRRIAEEALRRLGLDEVWWLVTPGNPLKDAAAPLATRLARARSVARHPRIRVTDLERRLGTRYTVDTLAAITRRWPRSRFVWLMGADNLVQIPRWRHWPTLFVTCPIAVFDRPSYSERAVASKAARRFAGRRLPERQARRLCDHRPPAWVLIHGPLLPISATQIRAQDRASSPADQPARGHPTGPQGERHN